MGEGKAWEGQQRNWSTSCLLPRIQSMMGPLRRQTARSSATIFQVNFGRGIPPESNGLGAAVVSMTWLQPGGTDVTGSAIGIGGIFKSKLGPITTTRTLLTRRSCSFCLTPPAGPATQRAPAAS